MKKIFFAISIILFIPKFTLANTVSLTTVGDIMLGRGVEQICEQQQNYFYPFAKIAPTLQNSDIVFGNLEAPLTPGRKIAGFEMTLRANPAFVLSLQKAGFKVLSIANNHAADFGFQGVINTIHNLNNAGIRTVGINLNNHKNQIPTIISINGIRVAFLSYANLNIIAAEKLQAIKPANIFGLNIEQMQRDVINAKKHADVVIVSMHAGEEYHKYPNTIQINFAHAAIDAGADLIIGHHPHVIQSSEKYHGKYIFYSLGNFIFDQNKDLDVRTGLLLQISLDQNGVRNIRVLHVRMNNFAQPEIISGDSNYIKFSNIDSAKSLSEKKEKNINYFLKNGRLTISANNQFIWQSPQNWQIKNYVIADSINSGENLINMNLWKIGSFGKSKPFWHHGNDNKMQNHLFIYRLQNNQMHPVWGSSALDMPNCKIAFADVNNDGKNELIAYEGSYADYPNCIPKYKSIWRWNGWGFTLVSRRNMYK